MACASGAVTNQIVSDEWPHTYRLNCQTLTLPCIRNYFVGGTLSLLQNSQSEMVGIKEFDSPRQMAAFNKQGKHYSW